MEIFQKRLKLMRKLRRLTLIKLGMLLGVNEDSAKQRIGNYERGVSMPDSETLVDLSNIFEIQFKYHKKNKQGAR